MIIFALNYLSNKEKMNFEKRLNTLYKLGEFLEDFLSIGSLDNSEYLNEDDHKWFEHQINLAISLNSWFTEENVYFMLASWAKALKQKNIDQWLEKYAIPDQNSTNRIGVVMAGNIPMVGFHDLLSVFVSGYQFVGKLSSDDKILIPAIAKIMNKIDEDTETSIELTQEKLKKFDAIIATGSNNTARYFEYYFGKYPNIIRKNRNGVGVLTGQESMTDLTLLGQDIFSYFGLGCRNISKLYVPTNYDFTTLFKAFEKYAGVAVNHKYANNYDYNKSIYLVNREEHFDNGFLLLKNSLEMSSPISVIFFDYYQDIEKLNNELKNINDQIQCIVCKSDKIDNCINLGQSQQPELWDYADRVDTLKFLLDLDLEKK